MDSTPGLVNRYDAPPIWHDVDSFFASHLITEDQALIDARTQGAETTMPNAEVAPNQGAFLALLAQVAGAKRVLEFGTLAGYSTIWFARAVGPQGAVVTLELEETNAAIAHKNFERADVLDRIDVLVGPALASCRKLIEAGTDPFDFVFIDADKPNNPHYLQAALRLTEPGALIVIDNVVRDGAVIDSDSDDPRVHGVRDVVEMIARDSSLEATALQTVGDKGWDGLIVLRRKECDA